MGSSPLQCHKMDLQKAEKKWTSNQRYPDPKSRVYLSWKKQLLIYINQETRCQTHIKVEYRVWMVNYLVLCWPLLNHWIHWAAELWHVVAVQSLSCVQLFVISWTVAHQASLSFTISRSLVNLMSIKSVMPSSHLILLSPSHFAFNLSQYQGLLEGVGALHQVVKVLELQVVKVLELQLQHQSFQWIFRIDFL